MFKTCKKPPMSIISASGDVCSFKALQAGIPLKSCVSQISGYQEGSGTPSPQNEMPLHAFSSASLSACGVNLWDSEYEPNTWISETSTGATAPHTGTGVSDYIPITPNTSYYKIDCGSSRASYFDVNKNCIGGGIPSGAGIITTPANAYYVRFTITDDKIAGFALNYPSTDTSYHAYNGNTYTFTFGQDIYQGYIDWKRGVVVGTMGMYSFTGSESWSTLSGQFKQANLQLSLNAKTIGTFVSSIGVKGKFVNNIYLRIYYADNPSLNIDDNTDMNALFANGVTCAYELATPIETPLGGINLLTQQGQNNIYCDTGNTTLEYLKAGR